MINQLLNTLYVQAQGTYLRLDHETIRVEQDGKELLQVPLHHLGGVAVFGNVLVSPFLLKKCGEDQRSFVWFSLSGRFTGRLVGPTSGNVLLRLAQHAAFTNLATPLALARHFVAGKIRNSRVVLMRGIRDGSPSPPLQNAARILDSLLFFLPECRDVDAVRGIEGTAAAAYYEAWPNLIRNASFDFEGRNRRPPRDPVNAVLSFSYSILANECASALEGSGLDPQIGFLHVPRPGRPSLALDLMEEFRAIISDRATLTLFNRQQLSRDDFVTTEGGAVRLTDDGRREFLKHWQLRKQQTVEHPVLERQVPIGLLPHVQARLLARFLRGDIPEYPPFQAR